MKIILKFLILSLGLYLFGCSADERDSESVSDKQTNNLYIRFDDSKKWESDWSDKNIVVCHWMSDPTYLHPTNFKMQNAKTVMGLTQCFIVVVDQVNRGIKAMLAKALPKVSEDDLRFTYELLDEATWDDGTPITSEDVIFTFKANKCPLTDNPTQKSALSNLKTIIPDSINPKQFTIVMKHPYIQSVGMLADFPILSRKFFDPKNILSHYSLENAEGLDLNSVGADDLKNWSSEFNDGKYGNDAKFFYGAGPYKVSVWDRGQTIDLQRKQNHWTKALKHENDYLSSYPERIIFKVVKDENAVMLECKSQAIDASTSLTTKTLVELQRDSLFNRNYNSGFIPSYNLNYIALNMRPDGVKHKKIFDDGRVRRAFALLTPVDRIIQVNTLGKAARWPSLVSPLMPEFNNDLKILPYDVAAASTLLEDAGWIDSDRDNIRDKIIDGEKVKLEVSFSYSTQGNLMKEMVAMIAEAAYPAGVRIIPQPMEMSVMMQSAHAHDFDMLFGAWATSSLPQDFSQIWSSASWASKGSNFGGFGNAASDALIDSINYTLDDDLRIPMVKRLQKIIYDEQPYIFMYSTHRKIIVHKRFGNAVVTSELPGLILSNLKLISGSSIAKAANAH